MAVEDHIVHVVAGPHALFFGLLIPLALSRLAGLLYPALFALGTTLPLLGDRRQA